MQSIPRRTALTASRTSLIRPIQATRAYASPIGDPSAAKQPDDQSGGDVLRKGARRDPELYVRPHQPYNKPPSPLLPVRGLPCLVLPFALHTSHFIPLVQPLCPPSLPHPPTTPTPSPNHPH